MKYYKYHEEGNDFIIGEEKPNLDYQKEAIKLCDRKLGIGAKGLIIYSHNNINVFNAKGEKKDIYFGGIRVISTYFKDQGIDYKNEINYLGEKIKIIDRDLIGYEIKIDKNKLAEDEILTTKGKIPIYRYLDNREQILVITKNLDELVNSGLAEELYGNPYFSREKDISFARIINKDNVVIYTYNEDGWLEGKDLSCAFVYSILEYKEMISKEIRVHLKKGILNLKKEKDMLYVFGKANKICTIEV
jgi:diaminopimelate epimerase